MRHQVRFVKNINSVYTKFLLMMVAKRSNKKMEINGSMVANKFKKVSQSIRSMSLKLVVSSMRNSWTIFENAPLCFRLFIQDRVFPLVLTPSSSSKTKQIIAAIIWKVCFSKENWSKRKIFRLSLTKLNWRQNFPLGSIFFAKTNFSDYCHLSSRRNIYKRRRH